MGGNHSRNHRGLKLAFIRNSLRAIHIQQQSLHDSSLDQSDGDLEANNVYVLVGVDDPPLGSGRHLDEPKSLVTHIDCTNFSKTYGRPSAGNDQNVLLG